MRDRLTWERDGLDWPNRDSSRFVDAAGLRWHVQMMGDGPVILLVHGTGAATHSWRTLMPMLANEFTVVAPDLPGHGFTTAPPDAGLSLPGMSTALIALLRALEVEPVLGVGHSAGAAVLAHMSFDDQESFKGLISLNGALLPLHGLAGHLFSPLAKLFAVNSIVPRLFALRAENPAMVERMIRQTGSTIDPVGIKLYEKLARNPCHVAAALGMMANWDLRFLDQNLPQLKPYLMLVTGTNDRTVAPYYSMQVRAVVPSSELVSLKGLGHLAHEERPAAIHELVLPLASKLNIL